MARMDIRRGVFTGGARRGRFVAKDARRAEVRKGAGGPGAVVLAVLAGVALAVVARRLGRRHAVPQAGWTAVTVLRDPAELSGPDRPGVLADLAEHYKLRITPAPGGRGSEVAVRPGDARARRRLREMKQLLETGEVLRVEGQPEGRRTLFGRAALPLVRHLARRGA